MKKKIVAALVGISTLASVLAGCGAAQNDKEIKVGAGITPHAEILRQVADSVKEKGYTLKVVEYEDYILPNKALENGEVDANYFQHQPYLDDYNKENKSHLVSAASIHFEPFGIYAGKTTDLTKLSKGATVAVPNDTANEARALLLLEAQGLIKLKEGAGVQATALDIVENPYDLKIKEIVAAQIARAIKDVDIACINGNYAIQAGYQIKDALALEKADSLSAKTYANIIAIKEGNESSEKTKVLVEALKSEKVKKYIEEKFNGAVVPVF